MTPLNHSCLTYKTDVTVLFPSCGDEMLSVCPASSKSSALWFPLTFFFFMDASFPFCHREPGARGNQDCQVPESRGCSIPLSKTSCLIPLPQACRDLDSSFRCSSMPTFHQTAAFVLRTQLKQTGTSLSSPKHASRGASGHAGILVRAGPHAAGEAGSEVKPH